MPSAGSLLVGPDPPPRRRGAIIEPGLTPRPKRPRCEVASVADNGQDAVAMVEGRTPPLVFIDIAIPGPLEGIVTAHETSSEDRRIVASSDPTRGRGHGQEGQAGEAP